MQSKTFKATPRKTNYAHSIAQDLQAAILNGSFAPGSRLPGQRELAAQFETSLPTVREAVGILAATGMIEVRHGSGMVIRETSETNGALKGWLGMAINDEERRDFLEARLLLESYVIDKVVERRETLDFDRLYDALDQMEAALGDPAAYLEADLHFHWELARCAGNTVLVRMLDAIQLPMRQQIDSAISRHLSETESLDRSFRRHVELLDALEAGDRDLARATIRHMINRAVNGAGEAGGTA